MHGVNFSSLRRHFKTNQSFAGRDIEDETARLAAKYSRGVGQRRRRVQRLQTIAALIF
jgi:hypothetical protein